MEDHHRDPRGEGPDPAEHGTERYDPPAHADVPRRPVWPVAVGVLEPERNHRHMRRRERQHRAERVEVAEEVGLARDQQEHRQHREEGDREPRRAVLAVHAGEERRQLAVLGQRPREPRYPDQARVRGDHQDRGRQDADVVTQRGLEPRAERQRRNDSQHRVVLVLRPEQRGVVAAVVHHG